MVIGLIDIVILVILNVIRRVSTKSPTWYT